MPPTVSAFSASTSGMLSASAALTAASGSREVSRMWSVKSAARGETTPALPEVPLPAMALELKARSAKRGSMDWLSNSPSSGFMRVRGAGTEP